MASKTGTWLIVIGGCIALFGLCALPGGLGPNPDKSLLGASMTALSAGMMLIAGGLYLKARNSRPQGAADNGARIKKGRRATCERCGQDEPVIQCRVHQLHLCGDCLGPHYDFRSCAYVPSTRRSTGKPATYAQAGGA
jgi:hypothetical protein